MSMDGKADGQKAYGIPVCRLYSSPKGMTGPQLGSHSLRLRPGKSRKAVASSWMLQPPAASPQAVIPSI